MDSMEKIIDFSNKKSKNMIQCLLNIKQIRGIEYGKIDLNEISDGRFYTANDMVRADCQGC